ncbi:O-antigen ligase family protein [Halomonas ramblicola]|uniref:O-antigen ligase family protein n=1 Tax=Halomonas ramblicola TaxID=747349 RepID=UPI0025B443D8|nr:O-antigen ligase family protein [Halomonas ramblicola]MDN3520747.1 O-antigen ligase family protein [Halomonas ramblicola]
MTAWRRGVAVVGLLAGPLLLPYGYWLAPILLGCLAVVPWPGGRPSLRLSPAPWVLPAASLGLMLAGAIAVALHDGFRVVLPVLVAALLGATCLPALTVLRPGVSWYWAGLAATGVGTGVSAVWQRGWEGHGRAHGFPGVDSILYGDLSLLVGVCCLAGLAWARHVPHREPWMALLLAGAVGGALASALSGARGGWLALPLVAWVFYLGHRWGLAPHRRGVVVGLMLLLLAGMLLWPSSGVQQRLGRAVDETQRYVAGEVGGSVGTRLEIYRGSLLLIAEAPLAGQGPADYWPGMQRLMAEGHIRSLAHRYEHAHNDLLDAWVRYGLPGLLAVFALYLAPLRRFVPALRAGEPGRRALALAGTLIPVCYFAFGLSYSLFAYPVGVVAYVGSLSLLWWLLGEDPAIP